MTHEQMLKKLELTHEEFKDLMNRLANLYASLNERQRAVLARSMPTTARAAKTFGADVTAGDLERLIKPDLQSGFAGMAVVAHSGSN